MIQIQVTKETIAAEELCCTPRKDPPRSLARIAHLVQGHGSHGHSQQSVDIYKLMTQRVW